eukprot:CAMPEP_0194324738 /NCGR_PEP_ID=MMETSP0171-20130528/28829_1 /TAXON_ID=218684 /ORGANISM="Corethron pennatum, Strain L29A3" /LENGTH=449 /DNA_ID=CAMNT_0039083707 /DNA_START=124 /DNA_END=1470 /DNA_ORIENTATION=+
MGQDGVFVRLLQWNILADGLGDDGFLSTEYSPIHAGSGDSDVGYEASQFMAMVRAAKQQDLADGIVEKMGELKTAEKALKKAADKASAAATVASLRQTIDATSQLVGLKRRFEHSPQLAAVGRNILSWDVRYDRIKATILAARPLVVCLQEMDHLQQFARDPAFGAVYACSVAGEYVPAAYGGDGGDDLRPYNYLRHLLESRTAFAPKSYSHARNFRTKRVSQEHTRAYTNVKDDEENRRDYKDVVDDDGVAIFWRRDAFQPVELGFLRIASDSHKSDGAVAVVLEEKRTGRHLNVITAHLPSGDDPKKEQERLQVLHDPNQTWTAGRIVRRDDATWAKEPYARDSPFDGLLSYVEHYTRTGGTTAFASDCNSRPDFPPGPDGRSVWTALAASRAGLASVWVQTGYLTADGRPAPATAGVPVSVNKMRGPASAQPQKIGEHQCELIDHV